MSPPPRRPADRGADSHSCVSGADDDAQLAAAAREVSSADAPDCRVGAGELGAALETDSDDDSPLVSLDDARALRALCERPLTGALFVRSLRQAVAALWGSSVHVETVTENTEAREGVCL